MNVKEQAKQTLKEIGIPVSVFCKKMEISDTTFYRWVRGDLKLSEAKENRIREYISKLQEVIK